MPHVLFYENGFQPTTRSIQEIAIMRGAGWDVTFAHMPSAAEAVAKLDVQSFVIDQPRHNLYHQRLAAELDDLNARLKQLNERVRELAARARGLPSVLPRLNNRRKRLTRRIQELMTRIQAQPVRVGKQTKADEVMARARTELEAVKAERTAVAAEIRAIHAARRTPTPLTAGTTFGDLGRIEAWWHHAAQELATVKADLFWAADMDGLAAVVWAREAAPGTPPLIFDCHEMWTALEYMPEMYQVAWRMLMDRFVPKADAVLSVSQPILDALVNEHGARRTLLVPNYASRGVAPPQTVRDKLGLAAETPLVIHVGNLSYGRHPRFELVVAMLAELPDVHVAYVGARDAGIAEEITELATGVGVAGRVHFLDPVPLEHLVGFLAGADVSLFMYDPTHSLDNRYAMPFKLFDSLSAGVPVVAPHGGTAADFLIEEGLGKSFTLGAPGALAGAIRDLLADSACRERARQRAGEFTWDQTAPHLTALVEDVLREHAAQRA